MLPLLISINNKHMTQATTATDNFRIIGIKDDFEDIDVTSAGVIFLVKLNLPFHLDSTGL